MSVVERLTAAWMKESTRPLPDLPHLNTLNDAAGPEQVRREVETTIRECEVAAEELQCQLDQRRFIVAFLRDLVDRPSSTVVPGPAPVAPVRLRRKARQGQPPAHQHAIPVSRPEPFSC